MQSGVHYPTFLLTSADGTIKILFFFSLGFPSCNHCPLMDGDE